MKQNNNLELLSHEEIMTISGGAPSKETSFAYDVFWTVGAIARGIWEFAQSAAEFQSSLPANLKK